MARIVGTSGCTTELLAELRRRAAVNLDSFAEVERFHASMDAIISEARAREEQALLAQAAELSAASRALSESIEPRVAERRAELATEANRLSADLAGLTDLSAPGPLGALRLWYRRLTLGHRHQALVRNLDVEATRPFRAEVRETQRLLDNSEQIVRLLPFSVEAAVSPLVEAKRYLDGDGAAAYFGALGEERVLETLRALPDDFTVFNNVTFMLQEGHRWKEHDEWVQRAQVDHVVVGSHCVFLLETKNWSADTRQSATFTPQHQVKRANHVVYCLAREQFGGWFGHRKLHLRNLVVMLNDFSERPERFPPPYQYVTRVPLGRLVQHIRTNRPSGTDYIANAEACEWIQRFADSRQGPSLRVLSSPPTLREQRGMVRNEG